MSRAINKALNPVMSKVLICLMLGLCGLLGLLETGVSGLLVHPMRLSTLASLNPHMRKIQVSNTGKQVIYLNVTLREVLNPGTPEAKSIPFVHQNPYQFGLVAAPSKLILQPGEHTVIRLVNLIQSTPTDRVYYVTLTPAAPELQDLSNAQGVHAGIQVVMAYGVLVIIRPVSPQPKLTLSVDQHVLKVFNEGNTTAVTMGVFGCLKVNAPLPSCSSLPTPAHLVFPGTGFSLNLPPHTDFAQIQLEQEVLGNYTMVLSSPLSSSGLSTQILKSEKSDATSNSKTQS